MATFITPVEVTPGSASAWTDVDNSNVPDTATGVILQVINTDTTTDYAFGARKNGSTDARTDNWTAETHGWVTIGCDSSGIFELYVGSTTIIDVFLVGYYESAEATFQTNANDVSLGSVNTWTDVDITSYTTGVATGAFVEHITSTESRTVAHRRNGSTDDRQEGVGTHCWTCSGCDSGEVFELEINATSSDSFLVGYTTDKNYWYINAKDVSLGSTGSYSDLTSLPVGSDGAYFEIHSTTQYAYNIRKDGDTSDRYHDTRGSSHAIVEAASRIVEGKIENVACDFYLKGWMQPLTSEMTDDFNRADNTDLGSDWTETTNGTDGDLEIKDNTLWVQERGTSGVRSTAMWNTAQPSSKDHYIQGVLDSIATPTPSVSSSLQLRSSQTDPNDDYYQATLNTSSNTAYLNCYIAGSFDHQSVPSITMSRGSTFLITIETFDASTVTMRVIIDGVFENEWNDTNANRIDANGYIGFQGNLNNDTLDDFEGGILGATAEAPAGIAASRRMVIIS